MEAAFWIAAWENGRTGFHRNAPHEKLITYYPRLNAEAGQKILVPLCGKSKDLDWLRQQGLDVHGVELHRPAVEAFFEENDLPDPDTHQSEHFHHYTHGNLQLSCGDFFRLEAEKDYDLVYDRAALVALPEAMRKDYARLISQALKPGGRYLLITFAYDQSQMSGPPFSVSDEEVHALYGKAFDIELLEGETPEAEGPRLGAVPTMKQNIYLLHKA